MARHSKPQGSINIGRTSPFGNPVQIGKQCPVCSKLHNDAGSTGPCYERYLEARLSGDETKEKWAIKIAQTIPKLPIAADFQESVRSLYGKVLYCPGCGVDSPTCHGRILERFVQKIQN
ncbi:MAG: DUF4326 domain-containing protein [Myxococcales bacterium]|nr:DUF4326 domain-containing protein [Myxococcales bacterium]